MKPLKEALINKNNRDWASKGEEWCLIFPFSGDQSRLEIKPNAVKNANCWMDVYIVKA